MSEPPTIATAGDPAARRRRRSRLAHSLVVGGGCVQRRRRWRSASLLGFGGRRRVEGHARRRAGLDADRARDLLARRDGGEDVRSRQHVHRRVFDRLAVDLHVLRGGRVDVDPPELRRELAEGRGRAVAIRRVGRGDAKVSSVERGGARGTRRACDKRARRVPEVRIMGRAPVRLFEELGGAEVVAGCERLLAVVERVRRGALVVRRSARRRERRAAPTRARRRTRSPRRKPENARAKPTTRAVSNLPRYDARA